MLGPSVGCRNSYSLYCAELMANMKDVPSTERMVLCSQQWKLLSQKEKDAYHKKCDQVRSQGWTDRWTGTWAAALWGGRSRMGGFGLQIPLQMSPSPFLSASSCSLDHQFLLRSSVTSLGPLVFPVHVGGTSRWPGWRMLLPRGLRPGRGLHKAGMGWGNLCVTACLHLSPEKERLRD